MEDFAKVRKRDVMDVKEKSRSMVSSAKKEHHKGTSAISRKTCISEETAWPRFVSGVISAATSSMMILLSSMLIVSSKEF